MLPSYKLLRMQIRRKVALGLAIAAAVLDIKTAVGLSVAVSQTTAMGRVAYKPMIKRQILEPISVCSQYR